MPATDIDEQIPSAAQQKRFLINLVLVDGKKPEVRSCEIINGAFRNRTSFTEPLAVDDVFVERISQAISACLSSLSLKRQVIALPTFSVETPKLVLANAHIMSSDRDDGTASVMLRFNMFFGALGAAFRPEICMNSGVDEQTDYLSAAILSDIAMPLLDLCLASDLDTMPDAVSAQAFLNNIAGKSMEIEFQIELIKRFVEQTSKRKDGSILPNENRYKMLAN